MHAMAFVAALLVISQAALAQAADTDSARADESEPRRIAVMSAFEPEWQSLKDALRQPETFVINGNRFVTGTLEGKDVVLFLSGVSMVNAAMTTQLALDRFKIEAIVFSGIAGGVDPQLDIGDAVVAERWGQYLEAVFARGAESEWSLPSFADQPFPNFGMIFPQPVDVVSGRSGSVEERFWFPVDGELLDVAREVAKQVTLERCLEAADCLSDAPAIVVGGQGVSGMAFVDNAEFRAYVFDTFEASVLDMESAAVAHVAYANQVPFIAFRSLSDLAGGGEAENEMGTLFGLASQNSARVVRAFLTALPERM
ncbi:5'-methylthioadenosine/S-adenosylhomocysteine nucleosidase [Jiella sp. LLJ827]|nr:5'-methylthioadenosine/S-adenosylhomocysteine nucleosidase [Jiella sp. LLJ827]MCQ0986702.1 5'-methylthioadenosine/S-adenosylhomocysteine nucleosidase [Jiella sp. LLJ827]